MSINTTYTCDGNLHNGDDCKEETHNVDGWLSIISDELSIKNGLPNNRLIEMNNRQSLHFCSKDCFINLFFKENED